MVAVMANAQDKKVDPTGTWTWSTPGRDGGEPRKFSLELKLDGEKVTGKLKAPGRQGQTSETDLKDAELKGDELSFTTSIERGGGTRTSKYVAKISGDTLKGAIERPGRDGAEPRKDEWEAKREKAK